MHEGNPVLLIILKCKLDYVEEVPVGLIMPTYLLEKKIICCYRGNIENLKAISQQNKLGMRSRCVALSALNVGAKSGLKVTAIPRPLYPRGNYHIPILQGAKQASWPTWKGPENLASPEIQTQNCPAL
jgi:hypothetical protein